MAVLNLNTSGVVAEPRAAATVILLRDGPSEPEVLLLLRNKALEFAGGLWVFPGGGIDDGDIDAAGGDTVEASRRAALREAHEESALAVDDQSMELLGYWTTPVVEKRRFHTAFFVARVLGSDAVTIDGGEIHDSQWITLSDAIKRHQSVELGLLPPTFLTLMQLVGHGDVSSTLEAVRNAPLIDVMPVVALIDKSPLIMLPGDAGYDSGDALTEGPRNRCIRGADCWEYVFSEGDRRYDRL